MGLREQWQVTSIPSMGAAPGYLWGSFSEPAGQHELLFSLFALLLPLIHLFSSLSCIIISNMMPLYFPFLSGCPVSGSHFPLCVHM